MIGMSSKTYLQFLEFKAFMIGFACGLGIAGLLFWIGLTVWRLFE